PNVIPAAVSPTNVVPKPGGTNEPSLEYLQALANKACIEARLPAVYPEPQTPPVAPPAKEAKFRLVHNFAEVNDVTKVPPFLMGDLAAKQRSVAGYRYVNTIDFASGFNALPMEEESVKYTGFYVEAKGHYVYLRMPFGLTGAPTIFCEMLADALHDLLGYGMEIWMDDVGMGFNEVETGLGRTRRLFQRCRERGLSLAPAKMYLFMSEAAFAGVKVFIKGVQPDRRKDRTRTHAPDALPGATPIEISDEIYSSPAMMRYHRKVQGLKIEDSTCELPRCVAAFMFSSDGLQFGNFCHTKGWPIFGSFGNVSKYERCKPLSNTVFDVAHIPTLMQEVWKVLLDDEFIHAWFNGIVIKCADGNTRRVFPRIMTYSADYPEKVLIDGVRNGGDCLCPRCLVKKSSASLVGTPHDTNLRVVKRRVGNKRYQDKIARARILIYKRGRSVQSQGVEALLKGESYVPTLNAFTDRLGNAFNIYSALVVDQLHEVGSRSSNTFGPSAVVEFDKRYKASSVPTFGSIIRLFAQDVSSMSRMAARDFEDILQLRLHTRVTMKLLKSLTAKLGLALRNFAKLTEDLDVREIAQEYARRRKRYESSKAVSAAKSKRKLGKPTQEKTTNNGRRRCHLNLNTYKMHSLGDYFGNVDKYKSTDSFSTQIGELHNRKIKAQYERTNRRNEVEQMTRISDICMVLEDIDNALKQHFEPNTSSETDTEGIESLLSGDPYFIGQKDRSEDVIPSIVLWSDQQRCDDAVKLSILQLRRHLLARFLGSHSHPDFDDSKLGQFQFQKGRMYRHQTLRVNYTTYDVHREQDVVNPSTPHCFVLLPAELEADSDDHPFIYAKVLGVYHARVSYGGNLPRRMDFVHVRWLYYDYERPGGWETNRLDRLNPKDIIRAAHLIPEFAAGTTREFLQAPASISHDNSNHTDWNGYYVNRVTSDENEGANEGEKEEDENEGDFDDDVGGGDEIGGIETGDFDDEEAEGAEPDSDQSVDSVVEDDEATYEY
ncbi:hypothetical protein FRC10_012322, partial [Ceratobasidium sp. 414]